MRIEKKIALDHADFLRFDVKRLLIESGFAQQHPSRRVNSLYFDRYDLNSFRMHAEGSFARYKVRLRWYGKFFGLVHPYLELKGKTGDLSWKRTIQLEDPVEMRTGDGMAEVLGEQVARHWPQSQGDPVQPMLRPVIAVRYQRQYLARIGGRARITIDEDIAYAYNGNRLNGSFHREPGRSVVIEMKLSPKEDEELHHLLDGTGILMGKNSKYINGVSMFF